MSLCSSRPPEHPCSNWFPHTVRVACQENWAARPFPAGDQKTSLTQHGSGLTAFFSSLLQLQGVAAVEPGSAGKSPGQRRRWARVDPSLLGVAGGLLLWTAFPPLCWWPLAWVAPAFWVWLVRLPSWSGKHGYWQLYAAGTVHWLVMLQWVRLPHWSAYFGWFALSAYLAVYLPAFVWLARRLNDRWRVSVVLAAPIVWCGLELLRSHLLTGFALELLGHSQVNCLRMIQLAAAFGGYGVGFVVMLVAACLARACPLPCARWTWWPAAVAVSAVGAVLWFGESQLQTLDRLEPSGSPTRIALIQGCKDTTFGDEEDPAETFKQYFELTASATRQFPKCDLVVWPESMYATVWLERRAPVPVPEKVTDPASYLRELEEWELAERARAAWMARNFGTSLLVGCPTLSLGPGPERRYNSALWIAADGEVAGRYDKMHPVMFGEYVPLGGVFPWLYRLTPMGSGLTAGRRPLCVRVGERCFSPCICFENTVPHLIRRQVRALQSQGHPVDGLITITNDGWFWGSSLLDVHLACGIFRAIEMRRPMLIAANTGFSAAIDAQGRVHRKGPRRDKAVLMAEVPQVDLPDSIYCVAGDWPAAVCLLVCGLAAAEALCHLWGTYAMAKANRIRT